MTLKKLITSAAVSAIAAGSLVPLSTAASAHEWNHYGRTSGQRIHNSLAGNDRHEGRFNRWGEHRQYNSWRGNDDDDGYRRHRNHNGRNLAIGAFAAILGLAIAAEAGRGHHYDNDYDND